MSVANSRSNLSSGLGGEASNPYGNHFFALEIKGIEVAHFVECSGLKSTTAVFEIEEGGNNAFTHKRPGQAKRSGNTVGRCGGLASV